MGNLTIRETIDSDLPHFFEFQLDPEFNQVAAFTGVNPNDRAAFDAHWARILADPNVPIYTIVVDDTIVGSVLSYLMEGERQISYSLGREYWGNEYASKALQAYLTEVVTERPIYGRAAFDNLGSIRVMEKCGFKKHAEDVYYANARGKEIVEIILRLD